MPLRLTTVIFTTLTTNSTTLYTTENVKLLHQFPKFNCSELVLLELGLINSLKTLVGLMPVCGHVGAKAQLTLYFMKKTFSNADGSSDLVTVVTLAHQDVNRTLVLSVLKKIMDKYFEFRLEPEDGAKLKLGEFKLYMTQIIKFEEMQYDRNSKLYSYGATRDGDGDGVITPNQLLLATGEAQEVRLLMLDNINKVMNRGDKINLLVDQTDRLTSSSQVFQRRAQAIKNHIRMGYAKFIALVGSTILVVIYLLAGAECGYPFFSKCSSHS